MRKHADANPRKEVAHILKGTGAAVQDGVVRVGHQPRKPPLHSSRGAQERGAELEASANSCLFAFKQRQEHTKPTNTGWSSLAGGASYAWQ